MKYLNLSIITMVVTAFIMKVRSLLKKSGKVELESTGITDAMWAEAEKEASVYRGMEIVLQFAKSTDDPNQTEIYNWVVGPCLGNLAQVLISKWCIINLTPENGFRLNKVFNRMATRNRIVPWPMSTQKQIALLNMYNRLMNAAEDNARNAK